MIKNAFWQDVYLPNVELAACQHARETSTPIQRASPSMSGEVLIFCVFLEHVVKLLTRRGSHILRISRTRGQTIDHKGGTQTMMKAF